MYRFGGYSSALIRAKDAGQRRGLAQRLSAMVVPGTDQGLI